MKRLSNANRAARDAAFWQAVADTKRDVNISDVVKLDRDIRPVKKAGEFETLCAFHADRNPSMRINDPKGTYFCFTCKASGDVISYVQETRSLSFVEAIRWLGAAELPAVDPEQRAKAAAEDVAERAASIAEAREVWGRCVAPTGTPAEVYARSRAITAPLPESIRFGSVYAWRDKGTDAPGPCLPAMVGAVVDKGGDLIGLQRIFLSDGGRAKANMRKPKLSLGRVRGGALRLGPVRSEIIVCEGPEDGLSIAQEMPDQSVWVALGTGMMPAMELPGGVSSIVVAGQNDEPGKRAALEAATAFAERGLSVTTMFPDPRFKDWNAQLQGVRDERLCA